MSPVSRLDTETPEMMTTAADHGLEVIAPRDVPLGGPRAMTVRRTLPNKSRTTIGAWCFLDHYGPDRVEVTGGMVVPPHPHIGLQTVSWLFAGDIEHRDSTGAHALVAPGEVNLMTAGWGIQHSEVSTPTTHTLHGVQLWVALPEGARNMPPQFDRATAVTHLLKGGSVHLFVGSLPGLSGVNLPTFTPLVGAELSVEANSTLTVPLDPRFEHGLLVDHGEVQVNGAVVGDHHLVYCAPGQSTLQITAGDSQSRLILIGGTPFTEEIVMWWNFVGRSHEEIEQARNQWQEGLVKGSPRFGHLEHMSPLPAPVMPGVRLKPRGNRPAFPPGTGNTLTG